MLPNGSDPWFDRKWLFLHKDAVKDHHLFRPSSKLGFRGPEMLPNGSDPWFDRKWSCLHKDAVKDRHFFRRIVFSNVLTQMISSSSLFGRCKHPLQIWIFRRISTYFDHDEVSKKLLKALGPWFASEWSFLQKDAVKDWHLFRARSKFGFRLFRKTILFDAFRHVSVGCRP